MAEVSYINLACQVLGIDPSTLLKSREEENGVVIINQAGQKFRFSFEYLEDQKSQFLVEDPERSSRDEDFKQYIEANSGDPERLPRDEDNKPKTASKTRKTSPAAKKTPAPRKSSTRRKTPAKK